MTRFVRPAFGLVLLLSGTTGCFTATPRLNQWARSIEQDLEGTRFEKEFGLKLGRLSTSLARGLGNLVLDDGDPEQHAASLALRGIRKVEVATYAAERGPGLIGPLDLERSLTRRGWQTLVRVRDEGEFVWIVYRLERESVRGMMVVALEDDELTLVRLLGKLDRTFAAAMQLATEELSEIDSGPRLADSTLASTARADS